MRKRITWTITAETDVALADLRSPLVVICAREEAVTVKTASLRWKWIDETNTTPRCAKRRRNRKRGR